MIRILLYSAVVISCFLISVEKLNTEKRKILIAKDLENVVFQMEALLKYRSYDVYQLCEQCFLNVTSFDVETFKSIRNSFSESFSEACEVSLSSADECTRSAYMRIADFLGMYESETQIAGLEAVRSEIKSYRIAMESELAGKRKLYLSLGAFSGIIICLVLA